MNDEELSLPPNTPLPNPLHYKLTGAVLSCTDLGRHSSLSWLTSFVHSYPSRLPAISVYVQTRCLCSVALPCAPWESRQETPSSVPVRPRCGVNGITVSIIYKIEILIHYNLLELRCNRTMMNISFVYWTTPTTRQNFDRHSAKINYLKLRPSCVCECALCPLFSCQIAIYFKFQK